MKFTEFTKAIASLAVLGLVAFGCQKTIENELQNNSNDATIADDRGSQTAQSVGVNFNGAPADIVLDLVNNITYTYNRDCAATYFTVSSTGCPPGGQLNALWAQVLNSQANKCALWNGTALTGASSNGCSKCTNYPGPCNDPWTLTLTPNAVPAAGSCWPSTTSTEGQSTVDISAQADIAGQSLLVKSGGGGTNCNNWNKKFSFSLLDNELTRVLGVSIALEKWNGATWDVLNATTPADVTNITFSEYGFMYTANGGVFGNAAVIPQLVSGQTQGEILDSSGNPASGDNFCGNNSGGGDGSYAAVAHGPSLSANVGEGQYRFTASGSIKGNPGSANQSFSVSTNAVNITIGAPNCN